MAISQLYADSDSLIGGMRASVRQALKASGGTAGVAIGSYVSASGPSGGDGMPDFASIRSTAKQIEASKEGIPYTAIRSVISRIAEQEFRIGRMRRQIQGGPRRTKVYGEGESLIPARSKSYTPESIKSAAPSYIRKQMASGLETFEDHPFLESVEFPNPYMCAWSLKYVTAHSMLATGMALWLRDPQDDGNVDYYYIPKSWAVPIHTKEKPFVGWKITPPGEFQGTTVEADDVIYFPIPDPANPLSTFSPLQSQAKPVNVDSKIMEAHFAAMQNGVRPGLALIAGEMERRPDGTPGDQIEFTPDQRRQLINTIRLHYRGVAHHGDPLILDRLIKDAKPIFPTPAEMDFMDSSKLTKSRIMQGFGVNGINTGEIEGANRAAAIVAERSMNNLVVNPLIELIGQSLTMHGAKHFETSTTEKLYIWMDRAKANDQELTLQRVRSLASMKVLTRGEAREYIASGELNLQPRVEDDDELIGGGAAPQESDEVEPPESGDEGDVGNNS